jgi:glycosyltransferase involved in cell wall biosynthesis
MTKLGMRPYREGDDPLPGSIPVSVVVLTRDEEPNIRRCLASLAWADQVVVVDSGSTDGTVPIVRSLSADVVEQTWLGYSGQREFALRLAQLKHDWVYFIDADEWVSPELAAEISTALESPEAAAFAQRFRIVFQGAWIRHCGWYGGSRIVRLVNRQHTRLDGSAVAERAVVDGPIHRLRHDIVDEDLKGLASWLHKHVRYAELEAKRRGQPTTISHRFRMARSRSPSDVRPFIRVMLKDVLFPSLPAKPVVLFFYMYVLRLGLLDGRAGLRFCFYRAWYEATINTLCTQSRS